MPKQKVVQTFTGGLAADTPPWMVPPNMVLDCKNFLFERGELKSRPGVNDGTSTLGAGSWIDSMAYAFPAITGGSAKLFGSYKTSDSDANFRLFRLQPLYAGSAQSIIMPPTEVATALPAGITGGFYPQATEFDGSTYITSGYDSGNNPVLIRVTNTTNTVTAIVIPGTVGANLQRFKAYPICTHLSRVLFANAGIPGVSFPEIYWSKIGDATVWTGDFTTGSVRLQEAADGIRGMGVIKNMVLVGRPSGFHVGVPTGNGAAPYDWKCIVKDGPGCVYPESFCIHGGICFFAGQSNIYMYDLEQITPIGEGILHELFQYTSWFSFGIRMFVTDSYYWPNRPQLHVLPTFSPSTVGPSMTLPTIDMTAVPHFVYDLTEKKWSRHIYDDAADDDKPLEGTPLVFDSLSTGTGGTGARNTWTRPGLIRRTKPATWMIWDQIAANGCDSEMAFTTGEMAIGEDPSVEAKLVRLMIVCRSSASPAACTCDVDYMLGNVAKTAALTFTIADSGPYQRIWINTVLVGNFFKFTFTFPAGNDILVRQVIFEYETTGQEVRTP